NGGDGGDGAAGTAALYYLDGGVVPTTDVSFNLAAQPVIKGADVNCTFRNVNFTSAATGNWDFDTVSVPQTTSGSSVNTMYSSAGRKNITYSGNVYDGFFNVPINANSYIPNITTTAQQYDMDTFILCKGSSADFTAVIPAADVFDWDFGGAVVPNIYTGTNFQNLSNLVFNTAGVFKIKVRISTACCGWSPYDSIYIIVDQTPVLGITGLLAFCPGDSTTLTASGAQHYHWTPATGLNTTVGPVVIAKPPSTTTYLLKGYSLYGYCLVDTQITVTIKFPPAITFTTNPATCGGNGSVTVIPNPAGNYTYQWNDPNHQTSATATSLSPGAYLVTVTDPTSNCTVSNGAALSAGTGIQAYIDSSQNASCNGYCDGVARVKGIGASGSYTYHWSNNGNTPLVSGLCASTYYVTVTDLNATCTATASIVISQPSPLAINLLDTNNATCPYKNDGDAYANGSGGTGPFQYLWNDPNMQDSAHAINLYPGTYTVIVIDQHGCVDSAHVLITSSPPIVADTVNVIDVSCFGFTDGAISLHVTGGLYPYTYAWQQLPLVTDSFPVNLAVGAYTAYITDGHGCIDTLNNIPVKQPLPLNLVATTDSVLCFGGATGAVHVSSTGGTAPYQFSIDGITFQASGNFAGLSANNYTVTVKDAHACTKTLVVTVHQPLQFSAVLIGTVDDKCFGDNTGTATISISGGTLNYSAVLGAQTLTNIPFTFTSLIAGNYTVSVTDANNCTTSVPATINQPTQLVLSLVSTIPATCYGQANGGLTVSVAGGTPNYIYSLNGGTPQASPVFNNILGGLEIVVVIDAHQCIDTIHVDVPQPPQTTFLDTTVTDVACFGQSNGAIDLIVTGTGGPWTYTWSSGPHTQDLSGIPTGTYTVTVVDANNCTAVGLSSIFVNQPPLLTATDIVKNDSCFGSSNGCITVTANGGTPAYLYTWSVTGSAVQLCNLPMGSYNVTVTDAHACTATISNISITQPTLLTVTDTFTNVSCPGKTDGTVTAFASGGTPAYVYAWSNGAGNVNPDINLGKGTYIVTVTDANNCTATVSQDIIELPGIILNSTVHNILCPPLQNGFVELSVTTSFPPVTFVWSNGSHSPNNFSLGDGTYYVTVTDANNCVKDTSFTIKTDTIMTVLVSPHDTSIDLGNSVNLTAITNGVGGNIASIVWSPVNGLDCSDCVSPVSTPIQSIYYVATVVSDSGCVAIDTGNVIVVPTYDIFIPNVFTPNGDGNNDYFEVFGNKKIWKEFEVQVFDRIGEKVYESNDMNFKWDGIYKGKYMMPAVFVYQIHLTYIDNHTEKLYKGSVTLVR
ncbi:MAG: hypothetical protein JWO06_3077, partial [Bacteroidota bacterium]|nr:hypothetical protein [Bacteroidota bacterium]